MTYPHGDVAPLLSPGDVCGGNEVIGLLGTGGFARVYEARDPRGARRALKVLDAEAEAQPKLRARLAQEGMALSLIVHVNVVRLYDAGVDGERLYLLLELCPGKTLREALHRHGGALPVETAVRWIGQAALGLAEAHRRGVVHRDLKPENLIVTPDEVVKVIDFGVAKLHGLGLRTTHEQKLGTVLYMSPEQIRGQEPDARMDVYALGLILYEALAGAHPIVTEPANVFQICALQINRRPRPLCEAAPHAPPALGAVVDRAIEKDPALRFPDMAAFATALHTVLLGLGDGRRAALRELVASATPAAPTAARPALTQPMSAVPDPTPWPAPGPGPSVLARTAPLGADLTRAVSAAMAPRATAAPPATTAPTAQMAAVAPAIPLVPLPPPHSPARSSTATVVVVLVTAALALAGAAWLVLRLWP